MIVDVLVNPYAFAVGGELLAAWRPARAPAVVIVSTIKAEQLIAVIAALSLGRPSHGGRRPRSLKERRGRASHFLVKSRIARGVVSGIPRDDGPRSEREHPSHTQIQVIIPRQSRGL